MSLLCASAQSAHKDVVRRVLEKYYRPLPNNQGPSWLSFLGNMKDSLWSIDLFRCESLLLKTHWFMVVMDQFSRKIMGFAVQPGNLDGIAICGMLNNIIASKPVPQQLSTDNDPLYLFHRWKANLRILAIEEIKTMPYVPLSHPYVERLIRSIRQELLDQTLFWNALDLQHKLDRYQVYFNDIRSHQALQSATPHQKYDNSPLKTIQLNNYHWQSYGNQLFQLPIAA